MIKIMLVEDDKSLREIYSIRLVDEGYEIVVAGDGEEALGLAVQKKPDLIITDVMMPKISGFDMVDILRSTPETKDIKIIIMTALSSEDQRRRSESLGADKYLVKSQCGIEDVINAVHEVLGDNTNDNAQSNIQILNSVATPEGQAISGLTPVDDEARNAAANIIANLPQTPVESPSAVASAASAANEMRVMNEMQAAQQAPAPMQTPMEVAQQTQAQNFGPAQQMPTQAYAPAQQMPTQQMPTSPATMPQNPNEQAYAAQTTGYNNIDPNQMIDQAQSQNIAQAQAEAANYNAQAQAAATQNPNQNFYQ